MKIGIVSLVLGACALLTALTHFWLGPLSPPPTLEQTVAEKAASVREAALAGLRGQPLPDSARSTLRWDADKVVWGATAILGGLALVLGLAGWSRDGKLNRGCVGGAVLGGLAIIFQLAAAALSLLALQVTASLLGALALLVVVMLLFSLLGG